MKVKCFVTAKVLNSNSLASDVINTFFRLIFLLQTGFFKSLGESLNISMVNMLTTPLKSLEAYWSNAL